MKFVVILVKRRRKAGFWGVISFKITLTKERKGKEKKGRFLTNQPRDG